MIISSAQVRLVIEYLQGTTENGEEGYHKPDVSPELVERVKSALASLPETREDRIEQARRQFLNGAPSSDEVADKMIARLISDSLR